MVLPSATTSPGGHMGDWGPGFRGQMAGQRWRYGRYSFRLGLLNKVMISLVMELGGATSMMLKLLTDEGVHQGRG